MLTIQCAFYDWKINVNFSVKFSDYTNEMPKKKITFVKDCIVWVDLGYSYGWWPAQYQVKVETLASVSGAGPCRIGSGSGLSV